MLKVFYNPSSPPSRAVLVFLKMNRIPHEVRFVNLLKGEQFAPEYIAINPVAQIPAIDDGGFHLSECHAILTYLHSTRHCADHWYPADLHKRALVDRYLHWYHTNIRLGGGLFRKRIIDPLRGITPSEESLKETEAILQKSLKQIDSWLAHGSFVVGTELSVADLSSHAYYNQLQVLQYNFAPYPRVQEWAGRLNAIPEVREVTDSFLAVVEKMKAARGKDR